MLRYTLGLLIWASALSTCTCTLAAAPRRISPSAAQTSVLEQHRAATPRLNSVFVSLAVNPHWNASRWATLVADLKAIEVENIILADSVTEDQAWYPTKIPGLSHALDGDVVSFAPLRAPLALH
eukprot:COSAG02_NODE_1123_length_14441_cov_28.984521_12_plen_124_part_00